jgi:flagellar basal body-associated protein FliL
MKNKITKSLATAALLNFISVPAFSAQAYIENTENLVQQAQYKNVATIKHNFAKQVALNYSVLNADLKQSVKKYNLVLNADQLSTVARHTKRNISQANSALQQLKGLPNNTGSLLQVRLASESMLTDWQQGFLEK